MSSKVQSISWHSPFEDCLYDNLNYPVGKRVRVLLKHRVNIVLSGTIHAGPLCRVGGMGGGGVLISPPHLYNATTYNTMWLCSRYQHMLNVQLCTYTIHYLYEANLPSLFKLILYCYFVVPSNRVVSSQSGNVVTCTVNFGRSIAPLFMKIWKFCKNMSCLLKFFVYYFLMLE